MGAVHRQVYAPPRYARARDEHDEEHHPRRQTIIFGMMFVTIAAFSGVMWSMYAGSEPHRIRAPEGEYKVRPAANMQPSAAAQSAVYDSIEGKEKNGPVTAAPPPEAPLAGAPEPAPPLQGDPRFVHDGPFVAQVAAIQSEAGVDAAWRRVAQRAPDLLRGARRDVVRADLGQRGIYYRVRAGYFADRANAALFCDRIRLAGQDCIVVAR